MFNPLFFSIAICHFNGMLQNIALYNVFKLINCIRKKILDRNFNGKWGFSRYIFSLVD